MLKITTPREAGALVFQLEGKLAGPWVQELEQLLALCSRYATELRRSVLSHLHRRGRGGAPRSNAPGRGRVGGVGMSKQMHREGIIDSEEKKA